MTTQERCEVLLITARRLSDDDHGAGVRTARIAEVLAERYRVTIVTPPEVGSAPRHEIVRQPDYDVIEFEPGALSLRLALRRGSTEGLSMWAGVTDGTRALIRSTEPAAVFWADAILASAGMDDLGMTCPQIVEFANVESRRYRSMARHGSMKRRLFALWEAAKAVSWQRRIARNADAVVALSEDDAARLPKARSIFTVRNGVVARPDPSLSSGTVVLAVGSWWYGPNRHGMRIFLDRDWPRVLADEPNARLLIVGRGGDEVAPGAVPGAEALGFVDDLDPLYARSALVLAPARSGGGSQLKLVGALERGRIVVGPSFVRRERTTDMPSGAIQATPDMAGTIIRLLQDPEARHDIERSIVRYARESSWTRRADPLTDYLDTIVRSAAPSA